MQNTSRLSDWNGKSNEREMMKGIENEIGREAEGKGRGKRGCGRGEEKEKRDEERQRRQRIWFLRHL